MELLAICIGGEHPGANMQVHDMRLVADLTIEATYLTLLAQWWGRGGSLHVDCWSEISRADA